MAWSKHNDVKNSVPSCVGYDGALYETVKMNMSYQVDAYMVL